MGISQTPSPSNFILIAILLAISVLKEAIDDIARHRRDVEANREPVIRLKTTLNGFEEKQVFSSQLKVGDFIILNKDVRIPADCLLLWTSEESHSCFIVILLPFVFCFSVYIP